jgi:hypothetical protein
VACYGLDRARLEAVAERIGPEPSQLLTGAERVRPELIADFHKRAAFNSPAEVVNTDHVRAFFSQEEAVFTA